ncbi:MAG: T9SS type A sorting domain-containing protein [Lentimicrobium sp.]|nr:T9SS type A sorting domain-containing protein [Lentimicrobium sp.]
MKITFLISFVLAALLVKGQTIMEFTNQLYIIDNAGNIDSVLFGNDSLATLGLDAGLNEQNIIDIPWDSPEIRSIHRTSDSADCPVNYWGMGYIFEANIDLKKDIRKSDIFLDSSIFFIFKIQATHYPVEVFSDFSEMFMYSPYNSWTIILKHPYECHYDDVAECTPEYQYLFTITDSTERYITVRLDFETGLDDNPANEDKLLLKNPVSDILMLDYEGRIQIFEVNGRLVLERFINRNEQIQIGHFRPGCYLIKTSNSTIKMIKE